MEIILASTSPRRRELIKKLNRPYRCVAGDYEEDMTLDLSPVELVQRLALGKASSVAHKYPDRIIVGADTVVVFQDQVLGKPHTAGRAYEVLTMLSGQVIEVMTGMALMLNNRQITRAAVTEVKLRVVSETEIRDYINTGEPLDKAGAFAVQGQGRTMVEQVNGDVNNVVGLPVDEVRQMLKIIETNRH